MQRKILSTFLCSAVVASCVFADTNAISSEPNQALSGVKTNSTKSNNAVSALQASSATANQSVKGTLSSQSATNAQNSANANGGGFLNAEFSPLLAQNSQNSAAQALQGALLAQNNAQNSAQTPASKGTQSPTSVKSATLLAQNDAQNQDAFTIGEVQSYAQNDQAGISKTYQLGAVEITAPQEVDYNPSVTTISAKDIKDKNADNIAQAVRMTPGVFMREASGRRGEPSINIRGYGGTQIGLYLDGIPIMSIYDRQTDFGQYVMQGIDTVHISKGFTSPVYGMTSLGGAINIVSARPQKELEITAHQRLIFGRHSSPDESRQGVSIGTNQGLYYIQADLSHTNRSQYPLSSDFTPTTAQPNYDKVHSYYKNTTAKLKLGFTPNENHEYSLNFLYQKGSKGGLRSEDDGGPWWKWPHYDKTTVYLLGTSYFTPNVSLNTRLYYDNFANELNMHGNGNTPNANMNWGSIYDDDTYGGILTLNWDIADSTNLKVGTNLKYDSHFSTDEKGVADSDLKEFVSSEFIQLSQGIGDFRFSIAASYDRADTIKEFVDDGSKGADLGHNFSVQGIAYYDFAPGNTLHINIGKKENLPTLKQRYSEIWGYAVPNPDLGVESAINYEIGYDLALESTALSVAAFYNDMTNMFVQATMPDSACSMQKDCLQNTNADEGYTYGAEIGVQQGFFEDNLLVVGANYSYVSKRASNKDAAGGTKITDYPNHIANAKIAVKPIRDLEVIALGTLESAAYYLDSTTTGSGKSAKTVYHGYKKGANYFAIDLSATYMLWKGLSVSVGVRNLTDRDNYSGAYANVGTDASTNHYAGRQWFAGFDYKY